MPICLADFHHEDLYHSLRMLFVDRLGWELFRPIGVDWYTEGYWMVHDSMATAQQYLSLDIGTEFIAKQQEQPNGGHELLNRNAKWNGGGRYDIPDRARPGIVNAAITLEAAKNCKIDYIISSTLEHFDRYEKFRQQFHPNAVHIFQMGNNWVIPDACKNLLNSTRIEPGSHVNNVFYHQEFDLKVYHPGECSHPQSVSSFLHYNSDHYGDLFWRLAALMPDWEFNEYGAGNRNGPCPCGTVASYMRASGFVWHAKRTGDGYGFNVHNAMACGRPVIWKGSQVRGQTAEPLLRHHVTGIDLDRVSLDEAANLLRSYMKDRSYVEGMIQRVFKEVVDFDREFEEIKLFLGRCT